jgi:hypothetical protein
VLDDVVATQDTVTQLIGAIRRVRREVAGAVQVIAEHCSAHDYDDPGKPGADPHRVRPRFGTGGRRLWCARVCGVVARRWGVWRRTGGGGSAVGGGRGGNEKRTGGFRAVGAPASEPLR